MCYRCRLMKYIYFKYDTTQNNQFCYGGCSSWLCVMNFARIIMDMPINKLVLFSPNKKYNCNKNSFILLKLWLCTKQKDILLSNFSVFLLVMNLYLGMKMTFFMQQSSLLLSSNLISERFSQIKIIILFFQNSLLKQKLPQSAQTDNNH